MLRRILLSLATLLTTQCVQRQPITESALAAAADNEDAQQFTRFAPWIAELRKYLYVGADVEKSTDAIEDGGGRIAAFYLQGLARLYSDQFPEIENMRKDFKAVEDILGEYDKWKQIHRANKGKSSAVELAKMLKKRDSAKENAKALFIKKQWITKSGEKTRLDKIETLLRELNWETKKKDFRRMSDMLAQQLHEIRATKYDMGVLESGSSLHQYRRDLRWFLISARVLNGMVVFRKNTRECPVPQFVHLLSKPVASSKYSDLPRSQVETKPCEISQCLFLGVVQTTNDFGSLKDEVEKINNAHEETEVVPSEYRKRAQKMYDDFNATNGLKMLENELDACRDR